MSIIGRSFYSEFNTIVGYTVDLLVIVLCISLLHRLDSLPFIRWTSCYCVVANNVIVGCCRHCRC